MGNGMSEEEENAFLEEAYAMSLDSPDIDSAVNSGTTAANCQPKHTATAPPKPPSEGMEVSLSKNGNAPEVHVGVPTDNKSDERRSGRKSRRSDSSDERELREREKRLSYVQMARLGYQELVNAIIRPPRADYKIEALGPPAFTFCGRRFTRTDFTLKTKRGLNLQCSHWEPVERASDRIPCVIYMHGNSSARVEVIPQLSYLLSLGLAVFSFDFAGSGKSDGDYVSLGYYEREDLMCIIAHLRATNVVSTIALWGRSMGAATALMHGDRDPSIACMILDSPFADLTQLAEEMVEKGREQGINVPNIVVSFAIRMIRGSVKRQATFDIKYISPINHADKCFIPALFVAGEHDDFINKRHSEAIHAKYAGDKNLIIVEGDHNSPRPKFMFDSVSIFLQTCLQIPNSWALRVHPSMNLMAPPWFFPGMVGTSGGGAPGRGVPRRAGSTLETATSNDIKRQTSNGKMGRSAPPSRGESQDMGMTLERQREIQASLFKMLGQSDDATSNKSEKKSLKKQNSSKHQKRPGSRSGSSGNVCNVDNAFERERSQASSHQSVNHASTFPPPTPAASCDQESIQAKGSNTGADVGEFDDDVRDGLNMRTSSPPSVEASSFSTASPN